ncbi:hypothetical protein BX666DRAFT_314753 [Dichotomocladium elegans]|nr:hypothetical protein BX666DRAFT_314753 [Dichotomocladium elegans]
MVKNILSEADFIVKIWGRPLELLFRGSPLLTHWGDTVSRNTDKLQHKMDLRIMSNEFIHDYDIGNAEFARCTSGKKYFVDKAKLVSNGKSQLNEMVKKFKGPQVKDIKICLFQIMGTVGNKLRFVDKVFFPRSATCKLSIANIIVVNKLVGHDS